MDATTLAWIFGAGLATTVGGLALVVFPRPGERALDAMLGFTAGIMLAATAFSLLVPGLERGSIAEVAGGLVAGAAFVALLDRVLPHAHARFSEAGRPPSEARKRSTLLLAALTIHNVPEGLAVGVAFAAGGAELGVPVALAIGIQNVPEGFAAAAPLVGEGVRRRFAVGFAAASGAVEPPSALIAFAVAGIVGAALPFGLGFAAGAMLYVVVDELIPESHARGFEREASYALVGGFVLMMVLDNLFG